MALSQPLKLSLRGLLIWGLLSILSIALLRPIMETLVPLLESAVDVMQSDYIAHLSMERSRRGLEVVMACSVTHDIGFPDGRVIRYLRPVKCAYIDAAHALVPVVVFLVPVLAWPLQRRGEVRRRMLVSIVLLPLVIALTAPVLLIGLAHRTLYPASASDASVLTSLLQPMAFVELGGGWLIALLAAAICIRCGQAFGEFRAELRS